LCCCISSSASVSSRHGLEGGKAELDAARSAAVEPYGRAREVLEEAAVVADEHERAARACERGFEPLDRRQVEVVRRLIQQQDIGRRRQHVRERSAAQLPAREPRRVFIAGEADLLEQVARLVRVIAGPQSGFDVGARRRECG